MTVSTITDWLDRLQGVRKSGTRLQGPYARPTTTRTRRSASRRATVGRVLVTCHAASGCTFEAIRDSLWPQGLARGPRGAHSAA